MLSSTASLRLETVSAHGDRKAITVDYLPIDDALYRLSKAMRTPGSGTWFGKAVTLNAGDTVRAQSNYDEQPSLGVADVDPIASVTDQEQFPRDQADQPDWLKQRLAEGSVRLAKRGD